MIELEKISLRQYLELEDKSEYDFAMKFAFVFKEPIDEYQIGEMTELPFGFVKDFQYDLETELKFDKLIEKMIELTKIKDIGSEPLDKISRFANYLLESMKQIVDTETETLAHEPDEKEINAGMDRFKGLGVYLQIRSLTSGDVTKFDAVRKLPYSLCFTELYTSKQISDYEKDYLRLTRPNEN